MDPSIEEAKRRFAIELAAIAGADGLRRLQPALDALVAGVTSAGAVAAPPEVAALRERNRMLEALLDALPDFVALYDRDMRVLFGNRAAAQALGQLTNLSRDEMYGKTIEELNFPPQIRRDSPTHFARVGAGETLRHEVFMPTPHGWRWRETLMSPVCDAAGAVEAVAICSREVHERKLAESRLRLLSKLTGLSDAIDHDGVFTALARMAVPELGDWCLVDVVSDGQLTRARVSHGDPAQAPLADELLRAPQSQDAGALATFAALDRSLRRLVADGAFLLPRVTATSLPEHPELAALLARLEARSLLLVPLTLDGELTAVATFVCSDETQRQFGPDDRAIAEAIASRAMQTLENARLHQQLRDSEERFRVALAHSQVSLFEVDRELRFRWLHVPLAMAPLPAVGLALGEIGGETAAFAAMLRQAIDSGQGVTGEVGVTKEDEPRCLIASIEPLRDDGGAIIGAIGAATDITDTKRVQEELARALGFRDQMLGILGHDLRNPLSAVTGLTGLVLLDAELPPTARRHVEHIAEAARRMMEMIGTLIDFAQSRFKQGGLPVAPAPCDLRDIAAAAVADLRAAHHARAIELDAPAGAPGHWDGGRMAQLVSNLVANALVHGDRAAPVRVALDVAGDDVVLRVSNRGPMIPRELVPTLFEPFRQGAAAGDGGRARGLGLGLYIVDQIVRGHGGTIAVDSTPDGTTFCVRVPRGG